MSLKKACYVVKWHPSQKSGFRVLFGILFRDWVHFEIWGGVVAADRRSRRRRHRRRGGGEGGRGRRRWEGGGAVHHRAVTSAPAAGQNVGHVWLGKELCGHCGELWGVIVFPFALNRFNVQLLGWPWEQFNCFPRLGKILRKISEIQFKRNLSKNIPVNNS